MKIRLHCTVHNNDCKPVMLAATVDYRDRQEGIYVGAFDEKMNEVLIDEANFAFAAADSAYDTSIPCNVQLQIVPDIHGKVPLVIVHPEKHLED